MVLWWPSTVANKMESTQKIKICFPCKLWLWLWMWWKNSPDAEFYSPKNFYQNETYSVQYQIYFVLRNSSTATISVNWCRSILCRIKFHCSEHLIYLGAWWHGITSFGVLRDKTLYENCKARPLPFMPRFLKLTKYIIQINVDLLLLLKLLFIPSSQLT